MVSFLVLLSLYLIYEFNKARNKDCLYKKV